MSETALSTASLLAQFPDNDAKVIQARAARDLVVSAMLFRGQWDAAEQYRAGNCVFRSGRLYMAYLGSLNVDPATDGGTNWVWMGTAASAGVPTAPTFGYANAGDGTVSLLWLAAVRAAAYTVKRATVSGGPYTVVSGGQAGTTFTDAGLSNGTTYYYVVTALNAAGEGPASAEASATPAAAVGTTTLDFAALGEGAHKPYPADYGSAAAATPDIAVSYGSPSTNLVDTPWSAGMTSGIWGYGSAAVAITFTPSAAKAVVLDSFKASLFNGDAPGAFTFTSLSVTDADGHVLWSPTSYPTLTSDAATTFAPAVTGPVGKAITLSFQDNATDGEIAINKITFRQL